jgi:DNA-binding MarR family transcriptional regulator
MEFQAEGDPGPAFHAIAFQLSSVGFAISSKFRAALAPFDIEPRQFGMLRAVGFSGGQSQKALAERLNVPTSSMVAAIDDLETRQLIERRPSAGDRRVNELHLTHKGKDLLQEVLPVAMETEMRIRNALGAEESLKLSETLRKIGELFGVTPGNAHSSMQETISS